MTSLIIPTHNQPEHLRQCLESIRRWTSDYSLLVIDNDADSESQGIAKELADRVIRIPGSIPAKRSLYDVWNRGIRHAQTKYVGILNDDIIATPGWLAALTKTLDNNPHVWCVSPRYSAGDTPPYFPRRDESRLFPARPLGFCFIARRNVFLNTAVGWFDTAYKLWGGDSEFFLKLRLAGHATVVVEESYIHHFGSSTIHTIPNLSHELSPDTALYRARWKHQVTPYQP